MRSIPDRRFVAPQQNPESPLTGQDQNGLPWPDFREAVRSSLIAASLRLTNFEITLDRAGPERPSMA
jgi:hypothetical protein